MGSSRRTDKVSCQQVDRTTYPPKMRKSLPLAKSTKRRLTPLAIGCPFRGLSRSKKPNGVGLTTLNSFASVQNGFFDRAEGRHREHQIALTGRTSEQAACSPPLLESLDVGVG